MNSKKHKLIYISMALFFGFLIGFYFNLVSDPEATWNVNLAPLYENSSGQIVLLQQLNRFSPLIFIGGWPRSGTTLMRILLDVNKDVRCGPESHVIPRILEMYSSFVNQKVVMYRKAIDINTLNAATTSFILEVIRRNGQPAKRICNKDPMSFLHLKTLGDFFPNAKFILMVRDGRAVTHSVFKRHIKISNVNISDPWNILLHWNRGTGRMYTYCMSLGYYRCLIVKYENLILKPRKFIKHVVDFLGIQLDEKMFSHSSNLKMENVSLNVYERSTDQVVKPISKDPLYQWTNDNLLPTKFLLSAHKQADMLKRLNYDISKLPPNY